MDLLAHAIPKRGIHQLVALDPAFALEGRRYHNGLKMLAVAKNLEMIAGKTCRNARFHAVWCHHVRYPRSLYPLASMASVPAASRQKLSATTARLAPGATSDTPKNP